MCNVGKAVFSGDEITQGHFDSGTSSMQTTPHHHHHPNTLPKKTSSNNLHAPHPESLSIEVHQLKNKIQHIESQLDEAQRNAEIEKSLIQAELKNENQVLAEDEKKLQHTSKVAKLVLFQIRYNF